MKLMKYFILIAIVLLLMTLSINSCFGPRVKITREYVTNSNWGTANTFEGNANVSIYKIIFKDTIDVFAKNFKKDDIEKKYPSDSSKHTVDSSFCFGLFYTDNWRINKIYFDREQKDIAWRIMFATDLLQKTKIIGKLELNSWYKMYRITYDHVYYVYVDSKGKTHVYRFRIRGWFI